MTDDEFLAAFEACTLPRTTWTHEAHLRMAWLYLTWLPFDEALLKARTGIQRYNHSLGNLTGYHETITVAYVRVIASRIRDGETFGDFRSREPELFDRTLTALLRYYTKVTLHSQAARDHFVEPDREALPA